MINRTDNKKVFRTGAIAKICGFGQHTVAKLIDMGFLKGYRFPGSKHRYVSRGQLIVFLKHYNISLGELDD